MGTSVQGDAPCPLLPPTRPPTPPARPPAVPVVERPAEEPPPFVVVVQGPPGVSGVLHCVALCVLELHAGMACVRRCGRLQLGWHAPTKKHPTMGRNTTLLHHAHASMARPRAFPTFRKSAHSRLLLCLSIHPRTPTQPHPHHSPCVHNMSSSPNNTCTAVQTPHQRRTSHTDTPCAPARQVGKTTLIKGIIRHYTRQAVGDVRGPVTLVAGKSRRLVLLECPQVRGLLCVNGRWLYHWRFCNR